MPTESPTPDVLREVARRLRRHSILMTTEAGSGHPTSCLSCADLMAVLFFREMRFDPSDPAARNVDTFVLSKGHAAPILWAALYEAGAIRDDLLSLRKINSPLEGHPTPNCPWVKVATGSLGQGLPAACGIALANRLDGIDARTYCLLGDGECAEGSVWEAAQFASVNRLSNLCAIVDVNGLGQSGPTPYGRDTSVYARRFEAFGWKSLEIDGHDIEAILRAFDQARSAGPAVILARTVKGKGVSFLEGAPDWHGKPIPKGPELEQALREVGDTEVRVQVQPRRAGTYSPVPRERPPGIPVEYPPDALVATREAYGRALVKLGKVLPDLVVLDGDVKNSTFSALFKKAFPDRMIEAYIAEQNMIGTALGLAACGKIPFASTFACFLSRAYDFIRMASHSKPRHLVLCGSHAGVSIGEDGPSQMGLEDLAMMRAVIGSTVLYPSDAVSAERLTEAAAFTEGIVYIRTTRPKTPILYSGEETFRVGGSKVLHSSDEDVVTIVGAGITLHEALAAHAELRRKGLSTRVIDAYSVKPIDGATLREAAAATQAVVVVEDHSIHGGLGDAVAAELGPGVRLVRHGVSTTPRSGKSAELLDRHGISRRALVETVLTLAEKFQTRRTSRVGPRH